MKFCQIFLLYLQIFLQSPALQVCVEIWTLKGAHKKDYTLISDYNAGWGVGQNSWIGRASNETNQIYKTDTCKTKIIVFEIKIAKLSFNFNFNFNLVES